MSVPLSPRTFGELLPGVFPNQPYATKVKTGTPRDTPASFQSILKCAVLLLPPLVNLHKVLRFNLTSNVSSANLVHLGAGRHTFDPLVCNGDSDVLLAALDFGRTNHRLRLCEIHNNL